MATTELLYNKRDMEIVDLVEYALRNELGRAVRYEEIGAHIEEHLGIETIRSMNIPEGMKIVMLRGCNGCKEKEKSQEA